MIHQSRFVIAVPDLETSSAYYRDVLGFSIQRISDPGWRFYTLGDCTIMAGECPDAIPPENLGDHGYFAYLEVDDVDSYFDTVRDRGASIRKTPQTNPGACGSSPFKLWTVTGSMSASPCKNAPGKD